MKILYFTDPHVRANSPGSRLDDFPTAILNKLVWIGDYAFNNDIQTIVVGGDWLDRPDVANSMMNMLISVLNDWIDRGIKIYTIIGNHDLYGYNPMTFDRTALSLLCSTRILRRLSREPIEIGNVSLTGVDAYYGLDKKYPDDYLRVKGDPNKVKINVLHGFLDDKPWGDAIPMTFIDDILSTDADITLTGHEHSGFGIVIKNGKTFCNPGALARVTASIGDINQEVKVSIITVNEDNSYKVELLPLPLHVARPANEVLNREKIEEEKVHAAKLSAFTTIMNDFQIHNFLSPYIALDEMAREDSIDSDIVEKVRAHIERAEIELKRDGNEE